VLVLKRYGGARGWGAAELSQLAWRSKKVAAVTSRVAARATRVISVTSGMYVHGAGAPAA